MSDAFESGLLGALGHLEDPVFASLATAAVGLFFIIVFVLFCRSSPKAPEKPQEEVRTIASLFLVVVCAEAHRIAEHTEAERTTQATNPTYQTHRTC